ncbi:MAG: YgiQ family radical SAM protein [Planctomycetia bacterium]|nr:YgiQ family radical SAM protein [Planctomycetia bacterium]
MSSGMGNVAPLPMSIEEMSARGWDQVDVVFVSGDAYVDHPDFATALVGRWLEANGYKVAILAQPDWKSCDAWRKFGKPRLCYMVSAGNLDSMVNHYGANRKAQKVDAFSPGGKTGLRPDRATSVYCQRAREAFPGTPILACGMEASLRRLAHYDYWSDKVRRSILLDAKADLLVFGTGEKTLLEVLRRLDAGATPAEIRDLRGISWRLGASEFLNREEPTEEGAEPTWTTIDEAKMPSDLVRLPSVEEVQNDKKAFVEMTRLIYAELNPYSGKALFQQSGTEAVVVNPPELPLSTEEMDAIYASSFTRQEHPSYGDEKVPALQALKDSIQSHRGCYGGCAFCAVGAHEGKFVQCRSKKSILDEAEKIAQDVHFTGTITDIGGPTPNMYGTSCKNDEAKKACSRQSCLHPEVCENLETSHTDFLKVLDAAQQVPNVRHVFVASGVRVDLALLDDHFMEPFVKNHVGGHLSTAPEHSVGKVLACMSKPGIETYDKFVQKFEEMADKLGKDFYTVPCFIASHPGCTLENMVELAQYLAQNGYRPEHVQDFLPVPFSISTCMYHTGINPFTLEEVYVPRAERERRMQRALLQYYLPENYYAVREALEKTGREDLVGKGDNCLVDAFPPRKKEEPESRTFERRPREENERREQRAFQNVRREDGGNRWNRRERDFDGENQAERSGEERERNDGYRDGGYRDRGRREGGYRDGGRRDGGFRDYRGRDFRSDRGESRPPRFSEDDAATKVEGSVDQNVRDEKVVDQAAEQSMERTERRDQFSRRDDFRRPRRFSDNRDNRSGREGRDRREGWENRDRRDGRDDSRGGFRGERSWGGRRDQNERPRRFGRFDNDSRGGGGFRDRSRPPRKPWNESEKDQLGIETWKPEQSEGARERTFGDRREGGFRGERRDRGDRRDGGFRGERGDRRDGGFKRGRRFD